MKTIFCNSCKSEVEENIPHGIMDCIEELQKKLIIANAEVAKWKEAWWQQRDATGKAAWQFKGLTQDQIDNYRKHRNK